MGVLEVAHLVHHALSWVAAVPSPAPKAESSSNFASLAALIASVTGLITAIGAIILGLHRRDVVPNPMADKAIEYLIKQNKELLKHAADEEREPPKPRKRTS